MTIQKMTILLAMLSGLAACTSGPPRAPIGLNKTPANSALAAIAQD